MKTIFLLFFSSLLFCSCLHLEQIEKRHYRNGFYILQKSTGKNPGSNHLLTPVNRSCEIHFQQKTAVENNIDSAPHSYINAIELKNEKIGKNSFCSSKKTKRNNLSKPFQKKFSINRKTKSNRKFVPFALFVIGAILAVFGILFLPIGIGILFLFGTLALVAVGLRLLFPKKIPAGNQSFREIAGKKKQDSDSDKAIVLGFSIFILLLLLIIAAILAFINYVMINV